MGNKIWDFLKNMFRSSVNPSAIGKATLNRAASMATGVATGLVMKKVTDKMMEGEMKKAQAMQAEALKQAGMQMPPSQTSGATTPQQPK